MSKDNKLTTEQVFKMLETIFKNTMSKTTIKEREITQLLIAVRETLLSQPMLLELEPPINVCGDIHGQFDDLKTLFDIGGWPPGRNYLFLGDYIDRGPRGLETMVFLLGIKFLFPENFFLLRGNHECEAVCKVYGFFDECKNRYSGKLWKQFCGVFEVLPAAAVIGERIFCCHGGLSPEMVEMKDVRAIGAIKRPCKVPKEGLLCDLLWADPAGANQFGFKKSVRGVSQSFGADVLASFLHGCDLDLLCRGHEVVENGYEFFANKRGVTLFSAANYCGEFDNSAAMMLVDESLSCSFAILPGTNRANEQPEFLPPKNATLNDRMQMSLRSRLVNASAQRNSQVQHDTDISQEKDEEPSQIALSSATSSLRSSCSLLQSSHFCKSGQLQSISPDYVALESISRFIASSAAMTISACTETAGVSNASGKQSGSSQAMAPSSVQAAIPTAQEQSVANQTQQPPASGETHCAAQSDSCGRTSASAQPPPLSLDDARYSFSTLKRSLHQRSPVFPDRTSNVDVQNTLFPLSNRTPTETKSLHSISSTLAASEEHRGHMDMYNGNAPQQLLNTSDSKSFRRYSAKQTSRRPSGQLMRLFSQMLPQQSMETRQRLSSRRSYQEFKVQPNSPHPNPNQHEFKLANAGQVSVRCSQKTAQPAADNSNGHPFGGLKQSHSLAQHTPTQTAFPARLSESSAIEAKGSQ